MSRVLRKMIDIGPAGVIYPGSAQDYRYHSNRDYFRETATPWVRYWADWPSLQPDSRLRDRQPRQPGLREAPGARRADPPRLPGRAARDAAALPIPDLGQRDGGAERAEEHGRGDLVRVLGPHDRGGLEPLRARGPQPRPSTTRAGARSSTRLPADAYGPASAWARFFEFLYRRYHYGQRASGRFVHGFDLVNEPNLQLWPQHAPAAAGASRFASGPVTITTQVAQLMATAQQVAARYGSSTRLYAPSIERQRHRLEPPLHALERVRAGAARRARRARLPRGRRRQAVVAPQLLRRRVPHRRRPGCR